MYDTCWLEIDDVTFSLYDSYTSADDVPYVYLLVADIRSVSPLSLEPEGHVLEVMMMSGKIDWCEVNIYA